MSTKTPSNVKPSTVLTSLSEKSKLSNIVSRQALAEAQALWSDYTETSNRRRDSDTLLIVAGKLHLIITQVSARRCRINPSCWHKLVRLEQSLRKAYYKGVNIEPNSNVEAA